MLYETSDCWRQAPNKRVSLFGMSGVGKTTIAKVLRQTKDWFHYSVDYRIGTKYLGEEIVDNFKKEAMRNPILREHLLNDSIYISSNLTFDNLSPLSSFLGKPGNSALGGIPFNEYIKRQKLHKLAEINATTDTGLFSEKAEEIYGYKHFVADTSGSLCEIVNPSDPNDTVLSTLSKNTLPVWIKASDKHLSNLLRIFLSDPKPMFYKESFLNQMWTKYLQEQSLSEEKVDPDKFMSFGFRALIEHRLPIYEQIATNWGVTVQTQDIEKVASQDDFIELVAEALDKKSTAL
ncbi:MAG: ATPase [Pseudomonadota bacterium]|nr:ATPase [Pseudomonadota bacterium]